ncbi:hypothetical protein QJS66_09025 [Kocuria rhizophila]|nr:hypothetical protein QJS66_09025 [Kocuria rhizophila]
MAAARELKKDHPDAGLGQFLEHVALVADAEPDPLPAGTPPGRGAASAQQIAAEVEEARSLGGHPHDPAHRQAGVPRGVPDPHGARDLPPPAQLRGSLQHWRRSVGSRTRASPVPGSGLHHPAEPLHAGQSQSNRPARS